MSDKESPLQVAQDAGVLFDPGAQHLDLSKEEKRRTTALLLAIQAYDKLIIKEAEYLREMHDSARRGEGPKIQPATMDAMVDAAIKFDMFIAGAFTVSLDEKEDTSASQATAADTSDAL